MRKLLTLGLNLILTATVFGQLEENITLSEPITGDTTVVAKRKIILSPGFHAPAGTKFTAQIDYFAVSDNHFDHNFVKTETALISGSTENSIDYLAVEQKSTVFNYFDGLGRQVQTVIKQGSPAKKDIVLHIEYDHLGRQVREYLPYSVKSQNGAFRGEAAGEQGFYYNNQSDIANSAYPFAEKVFDNSPLNRVLEKGAPGADWQPHDGSIPNSGHTVDMNYLTNTVSDGVIIWTVDNSGNCTNTGTYSVGNLFKNETIDENDHSVIEFVDLTGKTILKKTSDGNADLLTYYIYDDFDRLRYVLPPKATNQAGTSLTPASLSELIYYYEYDEKGRMIKKKIPGADEVLMIYDNRDRLILTQDGNLRSQGKWSFTKYDVLNRPIITGIVQITGSNYNQLVTAFKNHGTHYESINTSETYKYTLNSSYPSEAAITESDLLTVIYYDNYNSLSSYGYNYSLPSGFDAVTRETKPINQVTGTLVWNLDQSEYYVTVNYYDEYGRIIQTIAENHLSGFDILTTQYDFVGKVTQTKLTHTIDASLDPVEKNIWEFYAYDHAGRLTHHYHQYGNNSADKVLMTAYEYNENGEQIAKKMHSEDGGSNYLQEVDYKYNIRGWLTKVNDADLSNSKDLFGMELVYNNPVTNIDPTIEENYNGNITGMYWNTNGTFKKKRGYGFKYDDINRLTDAYYGDNSNWTNGLYDVQGITYDLNGNIESISRNAGAENGEIDNLDYVYNGNKLVAVGDAAVGSANLGFNDGVAGSAGTEYLYDDNGNMIDDANKALNFNYNTLNLLASVSKGTQHFSIDYDATGNKLSNSLNVLPIRDTRHYIGPFNYLHHIRYPVLPGGSTTESFNLEYILTPEGRITFGDAGEINYEYFLKDHLGNNRVVFADYDHNGTAEIVQEDSYFPFGMQMLGLSERTSGIKPNQYLYNGKELHEELGLGWLDYGARMYDPELGRWHVSDPIVENKYNVTLYGAFFNNPIRVIDPDGQIEYDVVNGNLVRRSELGGSNMVIYNFKDGKFAGKTMSIHYKEKSTATSWYDTPSNYLEKVFSYENAVGWSDYFKSGDWQHYLPVWGSAKRSGEAWEDGNYFMAAVHIGLGVAECAGLKACIGGTTRTASANMVRQTTKQATSKGVSVIGPRATYRQYAKKVGANFLNVTDDAWTWAKNENFLIDVIKRGDDVVFAGEFNPAMLDPKSVLAREIDYLTRHGYKWADDFSKLVQFKMPRFITTSSGIRVYIK